MPITVGTSRTSSGLCRDTSCRWWCPPVTAGESDLSALRVAPLSGSPSSLARVARCSGLELLLDELDLDCLRELRPEKEDGRHHKRHNRDCAQREHRLKVALQLVHALRVPVVMAVERDGGRVRDEEHRAEHCEAGGAQGDARDQRVGDLGAKAHRHVAEAIVDELGVDETLLQEASQHCRERADRSAVGEEVVKLALADLQHAQSQRSDHTEAVRDH